MPSRVKRSLTIKHEMFFLSFLFFILVLVLFAGIFLKLLYDNNIESAKNSLRECNSQIVTYTESMFHENATVVDILSRDETIIRAGEGEISPALAVFQAIHRSSSNITYIYSAYQSGRLLIEGYQLPMDFIPSTRPWYQAAAEAEGVARLVYNDAATGVWLFSQCKKLVDEQGNMVGVVAIDCSNESISQQLSTKYQYASQRSFIVNPTGTVLIHPDEREINTSMKEVMDGAAWNNIVSGRSNYAEFKSAGTPAMAYFERIPETDFIVITAIDALEVIKPIMQSTLLLVLLSIVISILLATTLSKILIRRFAQPFIELGSRIQNLAAGRPDETQEAHFSNEEINSIAKSIEVLVKDIASREEQRKAAEYLSFHDSMTGLYNRRFFEEELRRLDVKRNYPLTLVCCDINGLKLVNDVFGHALGDRLLSTVAACLERGCRADDIVARIGGDEFAIILPHTGEVDAKQVVMRMKSAFPLTSIGGAEVSASLGFSSKENRTQTVESVLRAADEMMYDQKLRESVEMKRRTVSNIITAAECEGLIQPLTREEEHLLVSFDAALCEDSIDLIRESYRLRKIGRCSLIPATGYSFETLNKRHTEIGYRILSALDEHRGTAGCILHYMEHWDGSGWPACLAGRDIPLISRVIAIVEAVSDGRTLDEINALSGTLYDPTLVALLPQFLTGEE